MGAPNVSQKSKSYKVSCYYAIQKRQFSINPYLTYKLQGQGNWKPAWESGN